jgi:SynChlorMet cassette protein ScmC
MKYPVSTSAECVARLALADGSNWDIIAANDQAFDVVSALAKVMRLQFLKKIAPKNIDYNNFRRVIVQVEGPRTDLLKHSTTVHLTFEDEDTIVCTLISAENNEMPALPFVDLSMVICRHAQHRGGVLVHGALAEWNRNGVILAGPGGRGKTTASKRLPHHWQSLCDDTTLVIRDNKGVYWAHPWPTWSTFMFNGPGGTWDVQHAVPLRGIFFLEQAHEDKYEVLGTAQSVCLLNESAEQASWPMSSYSEKNELRRLRLLRFNNICTLAQTVPSYVLRLGRNGAFWQEIERALSG